jgi:fluoride exporter
VDRYAMIALGGALGAIARYQLTALVQTRMSPGFPWGTFVVNITGCLAMGIVMTLLSGRLQLHPGWRFLIPIGFIGAYTTFSAVEFDTFQAVTGGAVLIGAANAIGSIVAGYAALWLGVTLARMS